MQLKYEFVWVTNPPFVFAGVDNIRQILSNCFENIHVFKALRHWRSPSRKAKHLTVAFRL